MDHSRGLISITETVGKSVKRKRQRSFHSNALPTCSTSVVRRSNIRGINKDPVEAKEAFESLLFNQQRGLCHPTEQGPLGYRAADRGSPINLLYRTQPPQVVDPPSYHEILGHRLHYARLDAAKQQPPTQYAIPNSENWHEQTNGPNSLASLLGVHVKHAYDPYQTRVKPQKVVQRSFRNASEWNDSLQTDVDCEAIRRKVDRNSYLRSNVKRPKYRPTEQELREQAANARKRRYQRHNGWVPVEKQEKRIKKCDVSLSDWEKLDLEAEKFPKYDATNTVLFRKRKNLNPKLSQNEEAHLEIIEGIQFEEHNLEVELLKLIVEREYCLSALRKGAKAATVALLDSRVRARLSELGVSIVEHIVRLRWYQRGIDESKNANTESKETVNSKIPDVPPMNYMWNGYNYMHKMITDFNFVPMDNKLEIPATSAGTESNIQSRTENSISRVAREKVARGTSIAPIPFKSPNPIWQYLRFNPLLMNQMNLQVLDAAIFKDLKLLHPVAHVWQVTTSYPADHELRTLRAGAHLLVEARHSFHDKLWEDSSNGGLKQPTVPASLKPTPFQGDPNVYLKQFAPEILVQCILDARTKHNTNRGCWVAARAVRAQNSNSDFNCNGNHIAPITPYVGVKASEAFWKSVAQEEDRALHVSMQFHLERFASFVVTRFLRAYVSWRQQRRSYSVTVIASYVRRYLVQLDSKWISNNAVVRKDTIVLRDWLGKAHNAAIRCQRFLHQAKAITIVYHLRRDRAATVISIRVRYFLQRHKRKQDDAATAIQSIIRQKLARNAANGLREKIRRDFAATEIQSLSRRFLVKMALYHEKQNKAATVIQSAARVRKLARLKRMREMQVRIQCFFRVCISKRIVNEQRDYFRKICQIQCWFRNGKVHEEWLRNARIKRALPVNQLACFANVQRLRKEYEVLDNFRSARRHITSIRARLRSSDGLETTALPSELLKRAALRKLLVRYQRLAKHLLDQCAQQGATNQKKMMELRNRLWNTLEPLEQQTNNLKTVVIERVELERKFERFGIFQHLNPSAKTLPRRAEQVIPWKSHLEALKAEEALHKHVIINQAEVVAHQQELASNLVRKEGEQKQRAEYLVHLKSKLFGDNMIDKVIQLCKKRKLRLLRGSRLSQERKEMEYADQYSQHFRPYLASSNSALKELKTLFGKFDKDKSSRIELGELQLLCYSMGLEISKKVLVQTLERYKDSSAEDETTHAGIPFNKFCIWWLCESKSSTIQQSMENMSKLSHVQLKATLAVQMKKRKVKEQYQQVQGKAMGGMISLKNKFRRYRMSKEEKEQEDKRALQQLEKDKYAALREKQLQIERQVRQVEIAKQEAAREREEAKKGKALKLEEQAKIQAALQKAKNGPSAEDLERIQAAKLKQEQEKSEQSNRRNSRGRRWKRKAKVNHQSEAKDDKDNKLRNRRRSSSLDRAESIFRLINKSAVKK